jgi:YfiH family protein
MRKVTESERVDPEQVDHWLTPDWNVPGVRAYCTTRAGDFSLPPYNGFNTANHVGDAPETVARCRTALREYFAWQTEPQWLQQVHGIAVVEAQPDGVERQGDAVVTFSPDQVCTLHTADCLPVFFALNDGAAVALAHAGWRGLAEGVLEATLEKLAERPDLVHVWLGPAISQSAFEVGDDVRGIFIAQNTIYADCFQPNERGRWQCDLYTLAKHRLRAAGVQHISGGDYCSFHDSRFFSFRREPVTGRMLSFIWIDSAQ